MRSGRLIRFVAISTMPTTRPDHVGGEEAEQDVADAEPPQGETEHQAKAGRPRSPEAWDWRGSGRRTRRTSPRRRRPRRDRRASLPVSAAASSQEGGDQERQRVDDLLREQHALHVDAREGQEPGEQDEEGGRSQR